VAGVKKQLEILGKRVFAGTLTFILNAFREGDRFFKGLFGLFEVFQGVLGVLGVFGAFVGDGHGRRAFGHPW
jgi:hypothetical protein